MCIDAAKNGFKAALFKVRVQAVQTRSGIEGVWRLSPCFLTRPSKCLNGLAKNVRTSDMPAGMQFKPKK